MDPERAKELPKSLKKFYKGEPLALGITQILTGILTIMFGIVVKLGYYYRYHLPYVFVMTPFWTGVLFIISGSLSVAAAKNPKPSLVKAMLGMNVVSTVGAGVAIIILSFSLEVRNWNYSYLCSRSSLSNNDPLKCYELVIIPYDILFGIMVILLLFSILEFCVSISNAAFGCKVVCKETYTETVVVVYQNSPPNNAVDPPADGKDVLNP